MTDLRMCLIRRSSMAQKYGIEVLCQGAALNFESL